MCAMDDRVKSVNMEEMGRRFRLVRQKLGYTQTYIGEQVGTSQLMIYRVEKGFHIMAPLFLSLLLFYSKYVSLDALLSKEFDIDDERMFSKDYTTNTIVREKLTSLREELLAKLDEVGKQLDSELDNSVNLLK